MAETATASREKQKGIFDLNRLDGTILKVAVMAKDTAGDVLNSVKKLF